MGLVWYRFGIDLVDKLRAYSVGGTAVIFAKGLSWATAFVVVWLLNQILNKETFGVYMAAIALIQLLAAVGLVGLDQTIIYRLSRRTSAPGLLTGGGFVKSVLMIATPLSIFVAIIVALSGIYGFGFNLTRGEIGSFFVIGLAVSVPLLNTQKIFASWYQARHRVSEAILVPASVNVSRAILLGLVLVLWPTPGGVVLGVVLSFAIPILIWTSKTPLKSYAVTERLSKQDFTYGLKLATAGLATHGMRSVNILMIGLLSAPGYTAEYAVAIQLSTILHVGNSVARPVFTPRLGGHLADQNSTALLREYGQNRLLGLVAAMVVAAIFVITGDSFLRVFGDYQSAYPMLLVITATIIFATGFGANGQYLNLAGYAGWSLLILSALLVATVVLNLFLIPVMGGLGAALSSLISVCALNVVSMLLIWRLDKVLTINRSVVVAILIAGGSLLLVAFANLNATIACLAIVAALLGLILREKILWYPLVRRMADLRNRSEE